MRLTSTLLTAALSIASLTNDVYASHPVGSALHKRQSSGRTAPLVKAFPGQAPLPTKSDITAQNATTGEVLPLQNIQGDVLIGMKKQIERMVFFHINTPATFKSALKKYVSFVTSTETLISPAAQQPQAFVNIAFSQTGLTALGITDDLGDSLFSAGQFADAAALGDDPSKWIAPFTGTNVHGVIILGSDQSSLLDQFESSMQSTFGSAVTLLSVLNGAARPGNQAGHEHFGFLDGISQPNIEGFSTNTLPGQTTVQNGVILTGRTGDSVTRPSWALDGTFMAFRLFQQLVPEFNKYLLDNAVQNSAKNLTTQQGAEFLGARMFGRWKSGAPIDVSPEADDPTLGADPQRNNVFDFSDAATDETRCPFSAHIRKTNPRADFTSAGLSVDANRAIRASIPYGPEVTAAEAASNTTTQDRGLLFVEYQANIQNGFRTQQLVWADNLNFIFGKTKSPGIDAIIGENTDRFTSGLDPNNQTKNFEVPQWVVPKGGEYFFVPSIAALNSTTFLG